MRSRSPTSCAGPTSWRRSAAGGAGPDHGVHAGHHQRGPLRTIVEEYALLRRLISVSGEIAELGYSVPEDVTKALDRAESLIYEVNEKRVTDSTKKLSQMLSENLDHLEKLYEKGDAITGTPTGYLDLDSLLSGLQKSALVVWGPAGHGQDVVRARHGGPRRLGRSGRCCSSRSR